ncbi:hypothetical protein LEM8419_00672 [Neolewinella maritima]|uniref:Uncharacterized protein n=1 Tax=Neolewinella maritima TaxID=1383882 RepID=A0ABM9AY77_9BACT|nr:hypothetical protein LEM8419_00672 [Neolewinella maritima]
MTPPHNRSDNYTVELSEVHLEQSLIFQSNRYADIYRYSVTHGNKVLFTFTDNRLVWNRESMTRFLAQLEFATVCAVDIDQVNHLIGPEDELSGE